MAHIRNIVMLIVAVVCSCASAEPATAPSASSTSQPASFGIIVGSGMAPCAIHVQALDIRLAHGTPLTARYDWDFGDNDSKYNKLTGWNAAHVFDKPGRYTIKLSLTDEAGAESIVTKTITIVSDTRRPIYVSASGNDANSGSDPLHPIHSLAKAAKLLTPDSKVLLRRGDRFDLSTTIRIKQGNVVFGAYGSEQGSTSASSPNTSTQPIETRPVIRFTGGRNYLAMLHQEPRTSDLLVQDICFDSVFDNDTEKKGMPDAVKPAGSVVTVRNCLFLNMGYGINFAEKPHGVLMQDCTSPLVTGLRSYLVWLEGSDLVLLGNTVANSTREHCIRCGGADRMLIAFNNFTNLDRRPTDSVDTAKGAMTIHEGTFAYIANNTCGKGELLVGPLGKGDGLKEPNARFKWAVIENNKVDSYVWIIHGTEHVICRNNIVRRSDWACFVVEGWNEQYKRGTSDVTIVNNTGINKGSRGSFLRVEGRVDGLVVANNVYIAPKLKPGTNDTAPLWTSENSLAGFTRVQNNVWPKLSGDSGVGMVGQFVGKPIAADQWLKMSPVKDDLFADVSLDDSLVPRIESQTIPTGAAIPGAMIDLNGKLRPTTQCTVGAVEVSR